MKIAVWTLSIIVLLLPVHAFPGGARASEPLAKFLSNQSRRLGLRYIDEHYTDGSLPLDSVDQASEAPVPTGDYPTIAAVVAAVRRAAPKLDVYADPRHPDVIHLADRRIRRLNTTPLTASLTGFSYKGDLVHLPAAIGTALGGEILCGNIETSDVIACSGFSSKISISYPHTDVPAVLTEAAYSFRQLNGNLWTSMTRRDSGGTTTTVIVFH